ncbi:MAG: LuxR C-terminal-related transcriptional regulator, partial [Nocardioidaceae bacterium]
LPRALRASVAAAADARRLQAPAEAARHLDGALELWDRVDGAAELAGAELVDLLLLAADAHQLAGDHDRALRLGRRALGLVDAALDPVAAGLIHERLGRFLWLGGRDRDALEEYRAAVRILPGEPSSARARVLAAEAQILILIGRFEQSRPIAEQARDTARSVEDSAVKAHALATLGTDLVGLDRRRDGIELLERALAVQSELAVPDDRLRTYTNLSDAYDQAGRLDDAVRLAQEGREAARGYGMVRYGSFMCAEIAWRHVRLGRLEEARRLIEEALDLTPTGIAATHVHEVAARLPNALGDVGRAEAHATEAARSTEMAMGSQFVAPVYTALVELARLRRDVGQVRALIARARELMAGGREDPFFCTQLFLAALAAEADAAERCRALGDGSGEAEAVESGRALGARVMELAATPDPTPHAASDALMARAELSRLARKDDPEPWRGAAAAYERLGYVLRAAEARMRLAETLLAVGVRGGAQDELRAAHATAERCGAIALRDEVAALARRARLELAGDGPGRSNGEAPLGLTERELEVLRLVAEGCTNRQIGEELFMSEKTASVHVSRILAKLEVRSRGEAGAVAHRLGLSAS